MLAKIFAFIFWPQCWLWCIIFALLWSQSEQTVLFETLWPGFSQYRPFKLADFIACPIYRASTRQMSWVCTFIQPLEDLFNPNLTKTWKGCFIKLVQWNFKACLSTFTSIFFNNTPAAAWNVENNDQLTVLFYLITAFVWLFHQLHHWRLLFHVGKYAPPNHNHHSRALDELPRP